MPASDDAPSAPLTPRRRLVWTWAGAAAAAVAFGLAFPPFALWPLVLAAPALLTAAALVAPSRRAAIVAAAVTSFGMWLALDAWLTHVTIVGYPLKAMYGAVWAVAFVLLVRRVATGPRTQRWPMALVLPIAWGGLEVFRAAIAFDGYPWFLVAQALVEAPVLVQHADLFGALAAGAAWTAVSGGLVDVGRRWLAPQRDPRAIGLAALGVVVPAVVLVTYGVVRMGAIEATLEPGPRAVLLQTNLPQNAKLRWTTEDMVRDVDRWGFATLDAYAEAEAEGGPADLVVWPEAMFPGLGLEPEVVAMLQREGRRPWSDFPLVAEAIAARTGATFLVGTVGVGDIVVVDGDDGPVYEAGWETNSAYAVFGPMPYQRYDKSFLTPFGETMPYISKWPWLEQQLLALGARGMSFNLDAAPPGVPLRVPVRTGAADSGDADSAAAVSGAGPRDDWRLATPICFEVTMAAVVHQLVWAEGQKRADAIVTLTNDGWFGWFDGGREQHAQLARLRAIEHRLPVLRSANTGVTCAIDPRGVITHRIGDGDYGTPRVEASLVADLRTSAAPTMYGRVGPNWPWIAMPALIGLLVLSTPGGRPADATSRSSES